MATYGEKVRKYEAIVRRGFELGLPPDKTSVERLLYYVGRAEKQGGAKSHWAAAEAKKNAKHLLQDSHKLAALLVAARKYL